MSEPDWKWWAGKDEECYSSGPFDARDDAVHVAVNELGGAHICEAYQAPVDLSKHFEIDDWLERTDEELLEDHAGEYGPDSYLVGISKDQGHDLEQCIRMAIQRWQKRHGISIIPCIFTEERNHEYIPAAGGEDDDLNTRI